MNNSTPTWTSPSPNKTLSSDTLPSWEKEKKHEEVCGEGNSDRKTRLFENMYALWVLMPSRTYPIFLFSSKKRKVKKRKQQLYQKKLVKKTHRLAQVGVKKVYSRCSSPIRHPFSDLKICLASVSARINSDHIYINQRTTSQLLWKNYERFGI